MNRRTYVEILGVRIPLQTLASVTSTPVVYATIGSYEYRYSFSTPDIEKSIKAFWKQDLKFLKEIATRKVIPINTPVNRQLFQYETL